MSTSSIPSMPQALTAAADVAAPSAQRRQSDRQELSSQSQPGPSQPSTSPRKPRPAAKPSISGSQGLSSPDMGSEGMRGAETMARAASVQQPQAVSFPADVSSSHCSFVLLAEFDIDKGSTLSYRYPALPPEAVKAKDAYDDHMLAELMLPDGAHARTEDWTTFFVRGRRMGIGISGGAEGADENVGHDGDQSEKDVEDLQYVINLVRTKHDNSVRRGALVKAMAIGTRHPYLQVFKPLLIAALDNFFASPGAEHLARLYDSLNALDLSRMPPFSRNEKLILRSCDMKDLFLDRFAPQDLAYQAQMSATPQDALTHSRNSSDARAEGSTSGDAEGDGGYRPTMPRRPSGASLRAISPALKRKNSSATLLSMDSNAPPVPHVSVGSTGGHQARKPSGASSFQGGTTLGRTSTNVSFAAGAKTAFDARFFNASVDFAGATHGIRIPAATFPEEVGEYSISALVSTFSQSTSTPTGPLHSHLHSNGAQTHPVIILFNAIATGKRVIFLGHGLPAHVVAGHVLSAVAVATGCGAVFRGVAERAFPYCNLGLMDELESTPGYIAGVTNPRFEELRAWDVLYNVENGRVTIAKDIEPAPPFHPAKGVTRAATSGTTGSGGGTLGSYAGAGIGSSAGSTGISHDGRSYSDADTVVANMLQGGKGGAKDKGGSTIIESRADSPDTLFMEEVLAAIGARYGERYVRCRFVDYALAFARSAARHEEHYLGRTTLGSLPSQPYLNGQLGSGSSFMDRETELKDIQINAMRCEGFLETRMAKLFAIDEAARVQSRATTACDVVHQVHRLRSARRLAAGETDLICATLARAIRGPDQIVELLALCPPYLGGLAPLAAGLFHASQIVRSSIMDLLSHLCSHPVGKRFVQGLNLSHRLALARLLQDKAETTAMSTQQGAKPSMATGYRSNSATARGQGHGVGAVASVAPSPTSGPATPSEGGRPLSPRGYDSRSQSPFPFAPGVNASGPGQAEASPNESGQPSHRQGTLSASSTASAGMAGVGAGQSAVVGGGVPLAVTADGAMGPNGTVRMPTAPLAAVDATSPSET